MASLDLTYDKSEDRWTKKVRGIKQRFKSKRHATKREAIAQFKAWLNEHEASEAMTEDEEEILILMEQIAVAASNEQEQIDKLKPQKPSRAFEREVERQFSGTPKDDSLAAAIDAFLRFKENTISKGAYNTLSAHIRFFRGFTVGAAVDALPRDAWEQFHQTIKKRIKDKEWSNKYGNSIILDVRGFYNWMYDTERIEAIPRFVKSDLYTIAVPSKLPATFKPEEIKAILAAATDEQRLHYLLMLNCGMTQIDLSDLTADMINIKQGTLTRRRTKHEHQESAEIPTVVYTLWKPVIELLKAHGKLDGTERVFTNREGLPLLRGARRDTVAEAFKSVKAKTGIKKSLKVFRKTGATILGSNKDYRTWRNIYLANTPKEVTDKSYDGTTILDNKYTEHIRTVLGIPNTLDELRTLQKL
ncbi:hypothetical protein GC163_13185 [bacterium]|nr:hypothetical protein [bacterium]